MNNSTVLQANRFPLTYIAMQLVNSHPVQIGWFPAMLANMPGSQIMPWYIPPISGVLGTFLESQSVPQDIWRTRGILLLNTWSFDHDPKKFIEAMVLLIASDYTLMMHIGEYMKSQNFNFGTFDKE